VSLPSERRISGILDGPKRIRTSAAMIATSTEPKLKIAHLPRPALRGESAS
jgi:hypothetical protein